MLRSYGRDPADRELFLLTLDSLAEVPGDLALPTPHFTCLLVTDTRDLPYQALLDVAGALLDQGLAASNCWRPDCERLDGAIDLAIVARKLAGVVMPLILTVSYSRETLDEALWGAIYAITPDDACWDTCGTCLVLCVGKAEWAAQIDIRLRDIEQLSRDVCGG